MAAPCPHEGVLVRLGISSIHGIGVFGQRRSPRDDVFANDTKASHGCRLRFWTDGSLTDFQSGCTRISQSAGGTSSAARQFQSADGGLVRQRASHREEPNLCSERKLRLIAAATSRPRRATIRYSSFDHASVRGGIA